jgi:hypothetical protein
MLNFCGIVVAMADFMIFCPLGPIGTTNFKNSGPPQYCTNSTLFDFRGISYVGRIDSLKNFY